MLNKAILMGRLTRDPELRHTQSNMAVCSFSLAIDRDRKGPNGERQTDFIDCVAWGRQAEFVAQWFTKGVMAIVVGRIQSRRWQDQNGNNRTAIEINCDEVSFGETKKSRENGGGSFGGYDNGSQMRPEPAGSQVSPAFDLPSGGSDFQELADDDGDVPF
ncbi:single-stranded DNA-binding protein [Butyricicoccus sp. Marseille-Q5471]|uniref:single-stranded DNA-binding protein n=1 Tax=Butyricicoccus sp. Marseille-Q5471 TaxID=3039493 RepID=UPI0024BD1EE0|nr:single-stranded DNA-binding protein [Butyricicoccus sp. Marseille-Q5471]